ncbi:MAG TPA: PAS domain-containing sensor histidine kinase, partial [Burkholderiaceae bacterium]|nr:PAS domain-containing sensor histidine kinase [Burkholderiaceae bacterium]
LESVREGQSRLDAIVGSAMDAIVTVDEQQRVVLFNAAAEKMFGCSAADARGAPLDRFIPARFRAHHREHVARFGRTGDTSRRMGVQTALAALRADGAEFPIEASISQATVNNQRFFTVILRDITERTNAERQIRDAHLELRRLSQEMLEVKEAERTRIARELHDELGQALTALKMDVDLLDAMIAPDQGDLFERTAAMRELLDFTVTTTRRISADLRPLVLDDLGLGAAAEWLVQNVVQRAGLTCDMQIDPVCAALGEPYASALFRVLQESLTNVVRHAHASRVKVRMTWSSDEGMEKPNGSGAAVLTVRDDGSGIDRGPSPKRRSFGLRGINERVLLLGGEVQIESEPGAGTLLWARIPVDPGARRSPGSVRSEGSGEGSE